MRIDIKALRELIPTLLISLFGLFLMTMTLYERMDREYVHPMHYFFILNSMLCFKNNIELNYADTMSSTVKKTKMHHWSSSSTVLIDYVFDSGLKMFFVSLLFGVLIGLCSNYRNIFELVRLDNSYGNLLIILSTLASSFFTTVCSCISTFICVVVCIFISISFDFDSDNIVLPIIASISDYICTVSLNYFSENIYRLALSLYPDAGRVLSGSSLFSSVPVVEYSSMCEQIFLTNCALAVIIVLVLAVLYHQSKNTDGLRLFSSWSLLSSFGITMVAGHFINVLSRDNVWVGCIIPFFNGVAGSIALIYIGKVTSFLNSSKLSEEEGSFSMDSLEDKGECMESNPNNLTTLFTLLTASACLSIFSCVLLKIFFAKMPFLYIFLFGVLLNIEVFILYYLINIIVAVMEWFDIDPDCHIVPLLNSLGDLLGIFVLGGTIYFLS